MQKLVWVNSKGTEINLTSGDYGITEWEGFSACDVEVQTQNVPFQDGSVFLDALLNNRELSVTLAINDGKDLEKRYRLRRELISALNPKLGEGYLIYTNDFISKRIKCLAQMPVFPTHNSDKAGTPKASLSWTACDPYWEDLEETSVTISDFAEIENNGDIEIQLEGEIIGYESDNSEVQIGDKKLIFNGNQKYNFSTLTGDKKVVKNTIQLKTINKGINPNYNFLVFDEGLETQKVYVGGDFIEIFENNNFETPTTIIQETVKTWVSYQSNIYFLTYDNLIKKIDLNNNNSISTVYANTDNKIIQDLFILSTGLFGFLESPVNPTRQNCDILNYTSDFSSWGTKNIIGNYNVYKQEHFNKIYIVKNGTYKDRFYFYNDITKRTQPYFMDSVSGYIGGLYSSRGVERQYRIEKIFEFEGDYLILLNTEDAPAVHLDRFQQSSISDSVVLDEILLTNAINILKTEAGYFTLPTTDYRYSDKIKYSTLEDNGAHWETYIDDNTYDFRGNLFFNSSDNFYYLFGSISNNEQIPKIAKFQNIDSNFESKSGLEEGVVANIGDLFIVWKKPDDIYTNPEMTYRLSKDGGKNFKVYNTPSITYGNHTYKYPRGFCATNNRFYFCLGHASSLGPMGENFILAYSTDGENWNIEALGLPGDIGYYFVNFYYDAYSKYTSFSFYEYGMTEVRTLRFTPNGYIFNNLIYLRGIVSEIKICKINEKTIYYCKEGYWVKLDSQYAQYLNINLFVGMQNPKDICYNPYTNEFYIILESGAVYKTKGVLPILVATLPAISEQKIWYCHYDNSYIIYGKTSNSVFFKKTKDFINYTDLSSYYLTDDLMTPFVSVRDKLYINNGFLIEGKEMTFNGISELKEGSNMTLNLQNGNNSVSVKNCVLQLSYRQKYIGV